MTRIEEFAESFAQAVRDAFSLPWAYGMPQDPEALLSVRPSWSANEIRLAWHKPDPKVAVIGTEYAWIQDPWSSNEDNLIWDAVAEYLSRDGWGDVHWDSINAGVHVMYIDIPKEWVKLLPKRAFGRI